MKIKTRTLLVLLDSSSGLQRRGDDDRILAEEEKEVSPEISPEDTKRFKQ